MEQRSLAWLCQLVLVFSPRAHMSDCLILPDNTQKLCYSRICSGSENDKHYIQTKQCFLKTYTNGVKVILCPIHKSIGDYGNTRTRFHSALKAARQTLARLRAIHYSVRAKILLFVHWEPENVPDSRSFGFQTITVHFISNMRNQIERFLNLCTMIQHPTRSFYYYCCCCLF